MVSWVQVIINYLFSIHMQDGATALNFAAKNGHSEIVSVLVKAHANMNLPNKVIHLLQWQHWVTLFL